MAAISKADYLLIADAITSAVIPMSEIAAYYLDAADVVLHSDDYDIELDLLRTFRNAYLSASSIYSSTPNSAVEMVRALQEHVIKRSGETTINAWYTSVGIDTAVDLSADFKSISAAAGYTIS